MADISDLSERESEILCLVAKGASNKQIAQELYISTNTVKVHLRNIFSKIGVSSRTEAAMYAVSAGLVEPAGMTDQGVEVSVTTADQTAKPRKFGSKSLWLIGGIVGTIVIVIAGIFLVLTRNDGTLASGSQRESDESPRWQVKADMITARRGFGVTTYGNKIFAVAGEMDDVVTNVLERYDPALDQWDSLAPKPLAVADISAVTIGGKIYVPGGRLESGELSAVLEEYDPENDQWHQLAPMPRALSAYTLVAFEGSIYLFGGWDGEQYVNSAYLYNPDADEWRELSPMITPRAYAGGAVAGGKIFVIGGLNNEGALDINEVYQPGQEGEVSSPWTAATPLPEARYGMGVASVADIIHIIGGIGDVDEDLLSLVYYPNSDNWEKFTTPYSGSWSNLGLVPLESRIYALGGLLDDTITSQNLAYQAIYTVLFPVVK
jgi:DNA-binding CsgD family transcriptional regulator